MAILLVRSTRVIRPNKKAVDMRYLWYPSVIVGKGLSSSRLYSYRLIVNDKKKCAALLSIRWEACSASDHAVRRSAQRFFDEGREWCHLLMSHHSGFSWRMGMSSLIRCSSWSCAGDIGSRDCRSMWVHGLTCPKVHVHNITPFSKSIVPIDKV